MCPMGSRSAADVGKWRGSPQAVAWEAFGLYQVLDLTAVGLALGFKAES